jgi:hypothetical protein
MICDMKPRHFLLLLTFVACAEGDPENNPVCGIAAMAGASMVLEQFAVPGKILTSLPSGVEGIVPARVAGYGTARAIAAPGPDGAILGYEGEGFPKTPGFALAIVEDSLDTFKGVLIYDLEPPQSIPQLGTVSSASATIPLFGLRVMWSAVSSERCPMFALPDTGNAAAER